MNTLHALLFSALLATTAWATPPTSAVVRDFDDDVRRGTMLLELEEDVIELRFRDVVRFDTNTANLDRKARRTVRRIATILRQHPGHVIGVTGHADHRPVVGGAYESNMDLSMARAEAVRDALVALGVDAEQIRVEAAAAEDPLAGGAPIAQTLNRRVEVRVLPDYRDIQSMQAAWSTR